MNLVNFFNTWIINIIISLLYIRLIIYIIVLFLFVIHICNYYLYLDGI